MTGSRAVRGLRSLSGITAAVVATAIALGGMQGLGARLAGANANLHLAKTVATATLTPNLTATLTVDHHDALPGDTLTYTATVSNTGATLSLKGTFAATNTDATAATINDDYDVVSTTGTGACSAAGSNDGQDTAQWTPLAGAQQTATDYIPVIPAPLATGLTLSATSQPENGVTYATSGDHITGTQLQPGATAQWSYTATITLTPQQITTLLDSTQVTRLRNSFHAEVGPRDQKGNGNPPTVDTPFCSQFYGTHPSGTASNVVVTFTKPDGTTAAVTAATSLAPGATATATAKYVVPVVAARGPTETDAQYMARLHALDASALTASATVTAATSGGPVNVTTNSITTTEHLPIVTVTKTGPAAATTGSTVTYSLALANAGSTTAAPLAVSDTLGDGTAVPVTGVPASLAAGATATAQATYAIPAGMSPGNLSDTAAVTWKDANGNTYGPLSSALTTSVTSPTTPEINTVSTGPVTGNFYAEPASAQTFVATPADTPAFGQSFPTIDFNPPTGTVPSTPAAINPSTRPFTDVTTDLSGNYQGNIVAQGNGVQAGTGTLTSFDAVFTSSFVVTKPGDVTFNIFADDGFLLGLGGGATRVSGAYENAPPSNTSPFKGYPLVGASDQAVGNAPQTFPVTIHFPAAGSYPFEMDYFECCGSDLALTMTVAKFTQQTSPLSVYVGYADGLRPSGSIFPFPWDGSPNVTFVGCCAAYDAGALRFDNSGSTPIVFDSVTVDIGGNHFDLWPHGETVPAGQTLILTSTANYNFDTSDYSSAGCSGTNGVVPKVNVTIGGVTTSYNDSNQILNTLGYDLACQGNESESWQRIGGGGTTINTPLPPAVSLILGPAPATATVGRSQEFTVAAMDGTGASVAGLPVTLGVFGANTQPLNATTNTAGVATFAYTGLHPGTDTLSATALIEGFRTASNQDTLTWQYGSGSSSTQPPPVIGGVSPVDGALVTALTPITAQITPPSSQTISNWSVSYQSTAPGSVVVNLAAGSGTPPATLATFDPTTLPNGSYDILISATASGGGTQTLDTTVAVTGHLKLGRYTVTYQDLNVPVNGFPMQVLRTYDTLNAASSGDFGFGWHVSLSNFRVAANRQLGASGWSEYPTSCIVGLCYYGLKSTVAHDVTVTWPDGHQEVFDFTPSGGVALLPAEGNAAFTARPGTDTTSTLQVDGTTGLTYGYDGNLYSGGSIYNPTRFDLTTRDGTTYVLDINTGLVSETDRNGNSLTVDANGIHSSSGPSITFTRDSQARITQIQGPNSGQTLRYSYDASGNLATVTDPVGNVVSNTYDSAHRLLTTTGAGHTRPFQSMTYDSSGRLTSITDANGNTTQVSNNVGARQQVITDATGTLTTVDSFDLNGDLIQEDQHFDSQVLTTTATYDADGRPLSKTDPAGHTWTGTYDASGNITSLRLPGGQQTSVTYNAFAQPLTVTDALGHVTTYSYDATTGTLTSARDAAGNITSYQYDSKGNLTRKTDALGKVWTYAYNGNGNLTSTTDPNGHTTAASYDASGNLISATDALGHVTAYSYDADSQLLQITDPLARSTTFTYNDLHKVASKKDAAGKITTYTYDGAGHLTAQTDPLGHSVTFGYDADGRYVATTDALGHTTSDAYDGAGRLLGSTDPLGRTTSYSYDLAGNVATMTQPNGGIFHYAYDANGDQISATDPLGHTTAATYNGDQQISSTTDALGRVTGYSYDRNGNPIAVTNAAGGVTASAYDADLRLTSVTDPLGHATTYGYDAAGNRTSVTSATGVTTTDAFDADNRLITTTNALGNATTQTYDAAGQLTGVTRPSGSTTTYAYDSVGRLLSSTDALGNATSQAYDAAGNLTTQTDANGHATTFGYDAANRQTSISDALGGKVTIGYDAAGQTTSTTDADGRTTTFAYDPLGNVASETRPGSRTTTSVYDLAGNLTSQTDPRGVTVADSYDATNNLLSQTFPGGSTQFAYDTLNRQTSMRDATGTTSTTYDAASNVTQVASPQGTIGYTYNAAGQRATMSQPQGTVTYGYDGAGRLSQVKDWTAAQSSITYTADGLESSLTLGNGATVAYGYDGADRLTSIAASSSSNAALAHFTYTLDGVGNRTSMSSAAGTEQYSLDALNRLTQVNLPGGATQKYAYDAAGNRTSETTGSGTTNYAYNAAGELTAAGSTTYGYDAAGNRTSAGATTYAYNQADRITGVTQGSAGTTYAYDGAGDRVASTAASSTTHYLYDTQQGLPQLVNDGSTSYVTAGNNLSNEISSGGNQYPVQDALGSVRSLTNSSQSVAGTTGYDVFGATISSSGVQSPLGFTGAQSTAGGSVYLNARNLDPSTGQFTSVDSVQPNAPGTQGYNPYAYAGNDPTTLTDPSGHFDVGGYVVSEQVSSSLRVGVGIVTVQVERSLLNYLVIGLAGAGALATSSSGNSTGTGPSAGTGSASNPAQNSLYQNAIAALGGSASESDCAAIVQQGTDANRIEACLVLYPSLAKLMPQGTVSGSQPKPHEAIAAIRWLRHNPGITLTYADAEGYDYVTSTGVKLEFVGADQAYATADRFSQFLPQITQHLRDKSADILVIDATAANPSQLNNVFDLATMPGVAWSVGSVQVLEPGGGIYP